MVGHTQSITNFTTNVSGHSGHPLRHHLARRHQLQMGRRLWKCMHCNKTMASLKTREHKIHQKKERVDKNLEARQLSHQEQQNSKTLPRPFKPETTSHVVSAYQVHLTEVTNLRPESRQSQKRSLGPGNRGGPQHKTMAGAYHTLIDVTVPLVDPANLYYAAANKYCYLRTI